MRHAVEPLSPLLSEEAIPHLEQMNMPYLGYHLLRETLTRKLLGESEGPILYWLGKDIGGQITIQSPHDLVLPFIRLGLGKLDVTHQSADRCAFTLMHSVFSLLSAERLARTLQFECGLIAGSVGRWQGRNAQAELDVAVASAADKRPQVRIVVSY